MEPSTPRTLHISAMGVNTPLSKLGKKKSTDQVELPSKATRPGWYDQSATPGEPGIATIVGYISKSKVGDGVFAKMAKLKKGSTLSIERKDGSTAVFRVDKIKSYAVGKFNSKEVYGDTKRAEVRLITCGGTMHKKDKPGNVVVFGHLIEARDADAH